MSNHQNLPTATATVEPNRLRLILQRLQDGFYDTDPASRRVAAALLADVRDFDEGRSALSH